MFCPIPPTFINSSYSLGSCFFSALITSWILYWIFAGSVYDYFCWQYRVSAQVGKFSLFLTCLIALLNEYIFCLTRFFSCCITIYEKKFSKVHRLFNFFPTSYRDFRTSFRQINISIQCKMFLFSSAVLIL